MKKLILPGIFLLALVLRVVGLSSHPAGFTPDEASFGYDAYSILKTGKDQWGSTMPLSFKSFGDYKLPLYTYLTIPSVALFGLTEFAVRLPNALLGSLAVVVTYVLVKELFKDRKLALISAFLLAISPWHIPLSRGGFEANLTTFLLPLGILLFMKSQQNKKLLYLAFVVFLANIFSYHTARLLTPLIFIALVIIYKYKHAAIMALILLLISIVSYFGSSARIASSGIFSDTNSNDQYYSVQVGQPVIIAKLFNNKFLHIATTFSRNYISYFSPQFLFTNGPAEGTYGMVPGTGVLYVIEAVFVIAFFGSLLKNHKNKNLLLIIFWIVISPIPAALTKGPGYAANRVAFMMPALQIISAMGFLYILEKYTHYRRLILSSVSMLFLISFIFFLNTYFVKQQALFAKDMIYGAKEVFDYLNKDTLSKDQVIITRRLSEPQIYAAFYSKMDPTHYQEESRKWNFEERGLGWVDQLPEYNLGRYIFSDNYNVPTMTVVVPPEEVPHQLCESEIVKKIFLPNGQELFYIRYNDISVSHGC